ncbi:aldose epimerase family protein [Daejeonella sp. H1SJ63]|uniref:aldose epimerase family protein n=1 Tax=Daejeonella sp. H1SJ63 TaxID=3034145 RepID=UPI0023EB37F7|nr:aldose epimerase family protein [Daejeonella sp. H1SJ63]
MDNFKSEVLFQHNAQDVYLYTLRNIWGVEVTVSNLGAIVRSFNVPDRDGIPTDIVLGYDKMETYLNGNPAYLGAMVGRFANRIGNASFEIDGESYQVSSNLPPHQLHGGFEGFDKKVWSPVSEENVPFKRVQMSYLSPDGEEGFPGNLTVNVCFELNDRNVLTIYTEASSDKATPFNLTHHDYFNLNGGASIIDHRVEIFSDFYLGQDADYVANGELLPVEGTQYDFRKSKKISADQGPSEGYDQSFLINKDYATWGKAATAISDQNGIMLEVFTDEPTVHFYTGKYLNVKGAKYGQEYSAFTGFCFETQHHANAVNIPGFPSTILRPGELYRHKTSYQISAV